MAVTFRSAMIVDKDGVQSEYSNVKILDNGWVKADVDLQNRGTTSAYFSPNEIERVYEP